MDEDRPILTAADVLAWRRGPGRAGRHVAIDRALLVADRGVVEDVRRRRRGAVVEGTSGPVIVLAGSSGTTAVAATPGVGAPAAAIAIEELAAFGVRAIVFVGYAGGLDPDLETGDVVVLADALRGEGVSAHYGATGTTMAADPATTTGLLRTAAYAGLSPRRGRSWTTDALYRETPREIGRARADGAIVVDLEVAAVYAVAVSLGLAAAGAVVVGDRLGSGRWEPPPDLAAVRDRLRRVVDAILDAWPAGPR